MTDLIYAVDENGAGDLIVKVIGNTAKGRTWLVQQDPLAMGVYVIEEPRLQSLLDLADVAGISFSRIGE